LAEGSLLFNNIAPFPADEDSNAMRADLDDPVLAGTNRR
jgi:hypothetical protein